MTLKKPLKYPTEQIKTVPIINYTENYIKVFIFIFFGDIQQHQQESFHLDSYIILYFILYIYFLVKRGSQTTDQKEWDDDDEEKNIKS